MSMTFTFCQRTEDGVYHHGADHSHHRTCTVAGCEDAEVYGWCDHTEAAEAACGCQDFDVNVSNANGAAVLAELGIEFDYVGAIDPSDLLARVMLESIGERTSVPYACPVGGLVMGQSQDRHLDALGRLATEAMRRGTLVGWS